MGGGIRVGILPEQTAAEAVPSTSCLRQAAFDKLPSTSCLRQAQAAVGVGALIMPDRVGG